MEVAVSSLSIGGLLARWRALGGGDHQGARRIDTPWARLGHDRDVGVLPQEEVERLVESIRRLLADPDVRLSQVSRYRWEGALVALEVTLGVVSSLPEDNPDRFLL